MHNDGWRAADIESGREIKLSRQMSACMQMSGILSHSITDNKHSNAQ